MLTRIVWFFIIITVVAFILIMIGEHPFGRPGTTRGRWVWILTLFGAGCILLTPDSSSIGGSYMGIPVQPSPSAAIRLLGWVLCFFAMLSFFLL